MELCEYATTLSWNTEKNRKNYKDGKTTFHNLKESILGYNNLEQKYLFQANLKWMKYYFCMHWKLPMKLFWTGEEEGYFGQLFPKSQEPETLREEYGIINGEELPSTN